jgi:hypothetical protein
MYIFYNKLINVCTTNLNIKNSYFPFQRKFTRNAKFRINEWQCVPLLQLILRLGISKYRNQCTIIKSNDQNSWYNYCTKNRSTCTNRTQFQRDRSYNTDWSSTRNSQNNPEQMLYVVLETAQYSSAFVPDDPTRWLYYCIIRSRNCLLFANTWAHAHGVHVCSSV